MGLDLVEYVMALEEAFEIAIPDDDAESLDTPAKLIDYLCGRLGEAPDGAPLVQTAFYRLRNAVSEETFSDRRTIRPSSCLSDLTTRPEKEVWEGVARRLELPSKLLSHAPQLQWLPKLRPAPARTLGVVAEQLAMLRPAALKSHPSAWTRQQVTEVVIRLLSHQVGVDLKPDDLRLRFVADLGLG